MSQKKKKKSIFTSFICPEWFTGSTNKFVLENLYFLWQFLSVKSQQHFLEKLKCTSGLKDNWDSSCIWLPKEHKPWWRRQGSEALSLPQQSVQHLMVGHRLLHLQVWLCRFQLQYWPCLSLNFQSLVSYKTQKQQHCSVSLIASKIQVVNLENLENFVSTVHSLMFHMTYKTTLLCLLGLSKVHASVLKFKNVKKPAFFQRKSLCVRVFMCSTDVTVIGNSDNCLLWFLNIAA